MTDSTPKLYRRETFADILNAENSAIACGKSPTAPNPPLQKEPKDKNKDDKDDRERYRTYLAETYQTLNRANRTALCLSGGGIRSASFCLGVLQRFSDITVQARRQKAEIEKPLLCEFDYLSTVSGGGYTGSWLSAWLFRRRTLQTATPDAPTVVSQLNRRAADGSEAEPIAQLRKNALFIARRPGALSLDIWDDIGTVARNLLLNWGVMLPAAMLVVLATQLLGAAFVRFAGASLAASAATGVLGIVLMTISLGYGEVHLPTRRIFKASPGWFVVFDLFFWLLGSLFLCFALMDALPLTGKLPPVDKLPLLKQLPEFCTRGDAGILVLSILGGAAIYFLIWLAGVCIKDRLARDAPAAAAANGKQAQTANPPPAEAADGKQAQTANPPPAAAADNHQALNAASSPAIHADPQEWWRTAGSWLLSGAIFGGLVGLGLWGADSFKPGSRGDTLGLLAFSVGVPYLTAARLVSGGVFAAASDNVVDSDVNLEWLARSAAYFLLCGTLLGLGAVVIIFGHYAAHYIVHDFLGPLTGLLGYTALASGTTLAGLTAALIGLYNGDGPVPKFAVKARKNLTVNQLAALAAILFALGFALIVSSLFDNFLFRARFLNDGLHHAQAWPDLFRRPVIMAVVLGIAAALFSKFVNINRFSLHGFYRNRLVRSFLGTSRTHAERNHSRDPFSDYDGGDNPYIRQLWPGDDDDVPDNQLQNPVPGDWQPFHVVNVTANLTGSKKLSRQERQAASFTISPLHAGSAALDHGYGAYLPTTYDKDFLTYGGKLGVSLGTAMAISGAALGSNMGYYSSPGISLLMTLFNVRLGWWLSNPARDNPKCSLPGPDWSLGPLVQEAFGGIDENAKWLLLSDGGHFDNTGLYEMVRRQCRTIVLVDGGCDAEYAFSDLGRSLMKIEIDLGVRIEFTGLDQMKVRFAQRPLPAKDTPYWAVGRIHYNQGGAAGCGDGLLLYLKASLHGTEPIGILSYGLTHPAFPQDSTVNQFYEESEFEAYRSLGFEIANKALMKAGVVEDKTVRQDTKKKSLTLDQIIEALEAALKPSPPADPAT